MFVIKKETFNYGGIIKMAKKKEVVVPEIVDSVETLEAKMKAMREAQKVFTTYSQEQVDKSFMKLLWQQINSVYHSLRWQ